MAKHLAFLGPAGTHTEQACVTYMPNASRTAYTPIAAVLEAVEVGSADQCVVPIENSLLGSVTDTLDLLVHDSNLSICHELVIPIKHYLIASHQVSFDKLKVVYSHPQALGQCRGFLARTLPNAQAIASLSTAAAVEDMLDSGVGAAAIATRRAAEIYGAIVISEEIEDDPNNMTRFVVLSSTDHPQTGSDKTSACFYFNEDAPGLLLGVLSEFADRGINLAKIESRPSRLSLGKYVFLVDFEGHRKDELVAEALAGVKSRVTMLKIFGSYPKHPKAQQKL